MIFLNKEAWMQVCTWIKETYAREFEISDIIGDSIFDEERA